MGSLTCKASSTCQWLSCRSDDRMYLKSKPPGSPFRWDPAIIRPRQNDLDDRHVASWRGWTVEDAVAIDNLPCSSRILIRLVIARTCFWPQNDDTRRRHFLKTCHPSSKYLSLLTFFYNFDHLSLSKTSCKYNLFCLLYVLLLYVF
jgi:hypothetical protein